MFLKGIRILDLSRLLPGPYASMLLADLGAEVIKIEQPNVGDHARSMLPDVFVTVNRNKKSLTLDLKNPEGRNVFCRLLSTADIVMESFRPGVMKRLGLDYESLQSLNSGIIYCSISGFGQEGPYWNRPGHDINYLGIAGALSVPGDVAVPPARPGLPVSDLAGSMFAAVSILAALNRRHQDNKGVMIDVSLTDSMVSWMSIRLGDYLERGKIPIPSQMPHLSACNAVFTARDKKELTIAAVENNFWHNLCLALGKEEWLVEPKYGTHALRTLHSAELLREFKRIFLTRDRDDWLKLLLEHDVPCGPVNLPHEAFSDPHLITRGLFKEIPEGKLKQVGFPVVFSSVEEDVMHPPPSLGQHTREILAKLGYTGAEIDRLSRNKVI